MEEMMTLLLLFYEFFKAGLFAVGGGLATLPFLYDIAAQYDWLPMEAMPDMIAVSESTPGPLGINMATYAGYHAYGVLGAIVATTGLVLPSLIVIIIVANFLKKFQTNPLVQDGFSGLRPIVAALIGAACWQVMKITLFTFDLFEETGNYLDLFNWKTLFFFVLIYVLLKKYKKHPVVYIAGAAVAGIVFQM